MNLLIAGLLACGCVSLMDAPLWPPASDYIDAALDCSQSRHAASCEQTRKVWTSDFNAAIAGENRAQKRVAYCLSTGCDGAIRTDPILGCAWGKVADGTVGATSSLKRYCTRPYLDAAGARAADAETETLRQMLSVR